MVYNRYNNRIKVAGNRKSELKMKVKNNLLPDHNKRWKKFTIKRR